MRRGEEEQRRGEEGREEEQRRGRRRGGGEEDERWDGEKRTRTEEGGRRNCMVGRCVDHQCCRSRTGKRVWLRATGVASTLEEGIATAHLSEAHPSIHPSIPIHSHPRASCVLDETDRPAACHNILWILLVASDIHISIVLVLVLALALVLVLVLVLVVSLVTVRNVTAHLLSYSSFAQPPPVCGGSS
jgi:hypothetical protein